jgi:hypothetical protein
MVVVYKGRGWLAAILAVAYLIARGAVERMFHPRLWESPGLFLPADLGVGAIVWVLGRRWNRTPEVVEEWRQGEGLVARRRTAHSVYWIPLEYWGLILAAAAIALDLSLRAAS